MSEALAWTSWAFRRAIGLYDFGEHHQVVLNFILLHSVERKLGPAREKAFLPLKQYELANEMGLDPGDFSKALKWLRTQSVIEVEEPWYWLTPPSGPPGWTAPVRVRQTAEMRANGDWLDRLDPDQPELLPPPPSLRDALLEVFVEICGRGLHGESESVSAQSERERENPGATSPGSEARTRASSWIGSKSVREALGKNPIGVGSPGGAAPGAVIGKFPSDAQVVGAATPPRAGGSAIGNFPSAASSREEKENENGTENSRSRPTSRERVLGLEKGVPGNGSVSVASFEQRVRESGLDLRAYVEWRLWQVLDEKAEKARECARMWERAIWQMPQRLDELIGEALDMKRTGRLKKGIGGFLNRETYLELQKRAELK